MTAMADQYAVTLLFRLRMLFLELHTTVKATDESYDYDLIFTRLREARGCQELLLRYVVADMRVQGRTWQDIGLALGMTRQSAWSKYAELDDDEDEDIRGW